MTKKILFSLILALGIFGVNFVLAVTCPSEGSWDSSSGVCIPTGTGLPSPSSSDPVATVLENVMQWLLAVIGVVGIIAFVISGVQYLMAAGDQNIIETAKRNMKWSIVGIVVALSGLIILNFIFNIMDGGYSGGSYDYDYDSGDVEMRPITDPYGDGVIG